MMVVQLLVAGNSLGCYQRCEVADLCRPTTVETIGTWKLVGPVAIGRRARPVGHGRAARSARRPASARSRRHWSGPGGTLRRRRGPGPGRRSGSGGQPSARPLSRRLAAAAGQHRAGRKAASQADTGERGERGESGEQELRGGRAEASAAGARRSSGAGRPDQAELPAGRYLDREESWLRFSQRVLELAEDENLPLLERVRFESIFASGLDEFFGVRVAGRIRRMATGLPVERASGKSSGEILRQTLDLAHGLSMRARAVLRRPAPARPGRGRDRDPALEGADRARAGRPPAPVPGAHLPGAHPAGGRPGPPVPLHLQPVAQPRGHDRRLGHRGHPVRPGQGPAAAAPVPDRRAEPVRPAGGRDRRAPGRAVRRAWTCWSTTRSGSPGSATWRSTRTSPRTCSSRWSAS